MTLGKDRLLLLETFMCIELMSVNQNCLELSVAPEKFETVLVFP